MPSAYALGDKDAHMTRADERAEELYAERQATLDAWEAFNTRVANEVADQVLAFALRNERVSIHAQGVAEALKYCAEAERALPFDGQVKAAIAVGIRDALSDLGATDPTYKPILLFDDPERAALDAGSE